MGNDCRLNRQTSTSLPCLTREANCFRSSAVSFPPVVKSPGYLCCAPTAKTDRKDTPPPPLSPSVCVLTSDLLEDAIVDQQLRGQRGQEGDADAKAETAARAVKRPPQADGECRQCQRQLHVVGKVHFLGVGGVKDQAASALFTKSCHHIFELITSHTHTHTQSAKPSVE